ncbi:helix-turn-helix domain-containing protein [Halobacillus fulvus]|nr:helix-turn-helix domain-containing protein [Halobacillus fulvus]
MVLDMDIGSRLKEARESRGLSLEEVQSTTKIQKRYLQAIEGNDFNTLPGKFYTRAFIREYASAVGLDPEVIMEEHKSELPTYEDEEIIQYSRVQKAKQQTTRSTSSSGKGFNLFPSILTLIVIVGVIFIFWMVWQGGNDGETDSAGQAESTNEISLPEGSSEDAEDASADENTEDDQAEEAPVEEEPEEEPTEPEVSAELTEEGSGSFPEHTYTVTGAENKEVTIELSGTAYLEAQAPKGGENLISPIEYSEETSPIELDFEGDQLLIKTGSAPNTTVKINGQALEYPNPELSTQKLLINFEE